jgi:hypothetical protein
MVTPPGAYSAMAMKRPSRLMALSMEFSELNTTPARSRRSRSMRLTCPLRVAR